MRFILVTGMSGAGKSTALRFLEDAGYFCVDNLPVSLIVPFAEISSDGKAPDYNKIALGIDIRNGKRLGEIGGILHQLSDEGIRYEVLYLDASDDVLLKRYKESRRVHPLTGPDGDVAKGISMERALTSHLRERADYIIDTSQLLTRELRGEMAEMKEELRGEMRSMEERLEAKIDLNQKEICSIREILDKKVLPTQKVLVNSIVDIRDHLSRLEERQDQTERCIMWK